VASAFVFLSANGVKIGPEQDERVCRAMIDIAEKRMDKTGLAEVFRNLAHGKQ
jgi:prophage maintenance system killer protein